MPRYAVGHIDFFDDELTIDIVEAVDLFEAIKKSPKACDQVKHVFVDLKHKFYTMTKDTDKLEVLKDEAFEDDSMINVVLIPDIIATAMTADDKPYNPRNTLL